MTSTLPRLKPNPIPPINPVPEYLADGALLAVYKDTKSTLQVPWMGVVTMAFAHYPNFYGALWQGMKPLCKSVEFQSACHDLRAHIEDAVRALEPRALSDTLADKNYAAQEIADIRHLIDIFSHGNMPYLMIATAARLLLEGHDLKDATAVRSSTERHGPTTDNRLTLIEPHHADAPTVKVYNDIKATLGLPFVNTDYRALARWPSYFSVAWADLCRHILTPEYEGIVAGAHEFATARMRALPNPGNLTPEALLAAAGRDGDIAEITEVVRLFQWLLPGLITNVAYFRAQLLAD